MLESSSRKTESEMHVALEMKQSIVLLAGTRQPEDTRESMIARAARRAGISFRQAKSFFYGETTNPRSGVVERVRAAIDNANAAQEAKARDESTRIREQIALLEQRLNALTSYSSGASTAARQPRLERDGALDRSVDRGA